MALVSLKPAGGFSIDVSAAELIPAAAQAVYDSASQGYMVDLVGGPSGPTSNPATGDNDLAQKVADGIYFGGISGVRAITSNGEVAVDYRAQLAGKNLSVALLAGKADSDAQAAAQAAAIAIKDFGAQNFQVSEVNLAGTPDGPVRV